MKQATLRFADPDVLLARELSVRADPAEVHVWPLLLEGSERARSRCESLLSAAELERARRFHYDRHRWPFVYAHGLMRWILGAYSGTDPGRLEFDTGEFGKPRIRATSEGLRHSVSFNLSHSHGRGLLAVSASREVGGDIEQENARTDALAIASSYFCASELEAIRHAPPEQCTETFFRYWAAKEAVLKAMGTGLHLSLSAFEVCFDHEQATANTQSRDSLRVAEGWHVRRLYCEHAWHAAVAARSTDWELRVYEP